MSLGSSRVTLSGDAPALKSRLGSLARETTFSDTAVGVSQKQPLYNPEGVSYNPCTGYCQYEGYHETITGGHSGIFLILEESMSISYPGNMDRSSYTTYPSVGSRRASFLRSSQIMPAPRATAVRRMYVA